MQKLNVRDFVAWIFSVLLYCLFYCQAEVLAKISQLHPDTTLPLQRRALTNSTFHHNQPLRSHTLPMIQSSVDSQQRLIINALVKRSVHESLIDNKNSVVKATNADDPNVTNHIQRMQPTENNKFQWKPALSQAMTFLWIEHSFRLVTEAGTRADLKGPFFKDWFQAVRNTHGWRDGDPFLVNYIGHPMQGAVAGYIYVHNDPQSVNKEFELNKNYFKSRMKAMLFSTLYSTQFELGPISEASLGNVGLRPSHTSRHPSAFVDIVVTPTLGAVWMLGEDALDRHVIKWVEDRIENRVVRILVRGFLNPSRSMANFLRGRWVWYRDGRSL